MAKTTTAPMTQNVKNTTTQFTNSTGACGATLATNPSNTLLLYTAAADDDIIKSIIVSSDDTSAKLFVLYVSPDGGTTKYWLASVSIPATSGQTGTLANVDILGSIYVLGLPLDPTGKPVLPLPSTYRLYGGFQAALTSGKLANVAVFGESYT